MTGHTDNEGRRRRSRWRITTWGTAAALLLLIPLVLTLVGEGVDGHGWHWTPGDFLFAFVLLFGTGLAYELLASKSDHAVYRWAVGIAVVSALLLVGERGVGMTRDIPQRAVCGVIASPPGRQHRAPGLMAGTHVVRDDHSADGVL